MSSDVKKIEVFIASPGDVANERSWATDVVRRVSTRVGRHQGFVLEPVRWETHALRDGVRPQATINQHVRDCDIFIGILWSRFGTPTSVAESGTEEEFQIVTAMRKETGDRPTIWMFFSDARPDPKPLRSDEGLAQWKKVVDFRARHEGRDGESEWFVTAYENQKQFEDALRDYLEQWCAQRFGAATVPLGESEDMRREYLKRLEKHRHLSLAGFPTNLMIPIDLERVFVPIRTRLPMLESGVDRRIGMEEREEVRDFASAWQFALDRDLRLLTVLGHPGSGKTTLLKHLALLCASGQQGKLGLGLDTLPLFVPLRDVKLGDDFAKILQAASDPTLGDFPPRFFAPALEDGRCLLLCDGLDEVANPEQRVLVSRWIEKLAERYPLSRIVTTSRFAGYRAAPLRTPHLQLEVAPLRKDDVDAFLKSWYRVVYAFVEDGSDAVRDRADRLASSLAERVWGHESLRRLAVNPMLLQLIALVRYESGDLPERRVELYQKCVDMLLERWDKARGLDTGLAAADARKLLQPLALWMHEVRDRRSAPESEILPMLTQFARRLPNPIDPKQFLESVRDRSGLLTGYGTDEYGFLHLSFQEYLAAEEIRNQRRFEFLAEHYDVDWWQEVTRLLVGLHNPSVFNDFMRAVAVAGKLRGHESFTASCVRDAREVAADPFIEAARPTGRWDQWKSRLRGIDLAAERYAAVLALRSLPKHVVAPWADELGRIADHDPALRALVAGIVSADLLTTAVSDVPVDSATGYPVRRVNRRDGSELILIPAGPFKAGDRFEDDNPEREESIAKPYYLARYPVTNVQFRQFVEAGGPRPEYFDDERFNQDQQPVVGVSWNDARGYCEWAGMRLPTEWEWEKGARGTDGRLYPWGDDEPTPELASFGGSEGQPSPVGSYPKGASPYGLLDMAGNVWEWTGSNYEDGGKRKTVRGGSFYSGARGLRSAVRDHVGPGYRPDYLGFRCAQDP